MTIFSYEEQEAREAKHLKQLGVDKRIRLGEGAFGVVYGTSSRLTCVKVTGHNNDNELIALMRTKGRKLKNVVNVHDVFVAMNGKSIETIYIVMERLKKLTQREKEYLVDLRYKTNAFTSAGLLDSRVKKYIKSLRNKREREFCRGIVNGAKELAKLGIDHHDMHSENFLKTSSGKPKFIDIGIVELTKRATKAEKKKQFKTMK